MSKPTMKYRASTYDIVERAYILPKLPIFRPERPPTERPEEIPHRIVLHSNDAVDKNKAEIRTWIDVKLLGSHDDYTDIEPCSEDEAEYESEAESEDIAEDNNSNSDSDESSAGDRDASSSSTFDTENQIVEIDDDEDLIILPPFVYTDARIGDSSTAFRHPAITKV
jgi:hypothetical protein